MWRVRAKEQCSQDLTQNSDILGEHKLRQRKQPRQQTERNHTSREQQNEDPSPKIKLKAWMTVSVWIYTTLWANSADDKLLIFFLFSPENRIWHFMQIVSIGDNLHEMSKPVF